MKRNFASLLAIFTVATAHAGSFGGPPPFTDGSPLVTGVDGSYQAAARAENLTGVFRFQYFSGTQTATASKNNWVFFVEGQIQRGSVVAAVNDSSVTGVLDSSTIVQGTNSSTVTLPMVIMNANNSSTGEFRGKMSANGDFSGSGNFSGAPATTNQIVGIADSGNAGIFITTAKVTNASGSIPPTYFTFTGVRTTTSVGSSSQ